MTLETSPQTPSPQAVCVLHPSQPTLQGPLLPGSPCPARSSWGCLHRTASPIGAPLHLQGGLKASCLTPSEEEVLLLCQILSPCKVSNFCHKLVN